MKNFVILFISFFLISFTISTPNHEEFELNQNWKFKEFQSSNDYLPAVVPGSVHLDLISNKLLPDPYYRDNEKYLSAFESTSWEYFTFFSLSDSLLSYPNLEIIFEGLDTHATIYFNENEILQAHDYFLEYQISVKDLAKKENNTLKIIFESAIVHDEKKRISFLPNIVPADNPNRTPFSRKPRFHYGWDWGPRIVTAGIAKRIKIRGFIGFKIETLNIETIEYKEHILNQHPINFIRQSHNIHQDQYREKSIKNYFNEFSTKNENNILTNSDLFDALMLVEFRLSLSKGEKIEDFFKNESEIIFSTYVNNKTLTLYPDVKLNGSLFYFTFEISGIELWWTRGLGKQILYDFKLAIQKNGLKEEIKQRTGIRKVKLINEKDDIGESFLINLNEKNVFAKGANYIPPEYFESKITQEKLGNDTKDMIEANYNAIRIWGGGYFLPPFFYDLMDSAGIMVFHDLMFACEMYPATQEYIELYELEIKQNVEKLKSHPSIVLWIGNNEVHEAWDNWGFQSGLTEDNKQLVWGWYLTIFHNLLPSLIFSQPYWPSSPLYGYGHSESLLSGDSHFWSVWAGQKPISEYLKSGRFMTEYGMQGFPDQNTIFSFTKEKDRDLQSDVMKRHEKHLKGFENLGIYLEELFGYVPVNFKEYSYLTQVLQSFAIRTAIESHRSSAYCMGTLYWQMNDIWPGITWSSVDYYGRYKALHYEVKNLYKDLVFVGRKEINNLISNSTNLNKEKVELHDRFEEIIIYLINDLKYLIAGSVEVVTRNVKGEKLESKLFDVSQESGSKSVIRVNKNSIHASTMMAPLFYHVQGKFVGKNGQIIEEEYGFMNGWPKEWGLIKSAKIDIQMIKRDIRIKGDVIFRYLYIYLEDRYLKLDRNYFDVVPGKVYTCKILNWDSIGEVQENDLKWISLNDFLKD